VVLLLNKDWILRLDCTSNCRKLMKMTRKYAREKSRIDLTGMMLNVLNRWVVDVRRSLHLSPFCPCFAASLRLVT